MAAQELYKDYFGSISEIVNFLRRDEIRNISILNFMENNPVTSVDRYGDTVIMRGRSDENWVYVSSPDVPELSRHLNKLTKEDKFFASIEDWMIPMLADGRDVQWRFPLVRFILSEPESTPQSPKSETRALSPDDAKYIFKNSEYQHVTSVQYIKSRIEEGFSAGIYEGDEPVAWGMTHDDTAIGTLHVLEKHRRKGYAKDIVISIVNQMLDDGHTPFACIEKSNFNSMGLFEKLGFKKDRNVCWFGVK